MPTATCHTSKVKAVQLKNNCTRNSTNCTQRNYLPHGWKNIDMELYLVVGEIELALPNFNLPTLKRLCYLFGLIFMPPIIIQLTAHFHQI